ncbi:MAG: hypothetical protein L3J71_12095 [Victivallaceae bacterium]|nr:hypothetical protein [Victivallaceae bacterium]
MKYASIITIIFILSMIKLNGAEVNKRSTTWTYNQIVCEIDYVKISNNNASYTLEFGLRNQQNKDPQYYIGMFAPVPHSNFRRNGFIDVVVNDISMRDLEPESLKPWTKNNAAGVTALFNFDGIAVKLNFYLKDNSAILWCNLSLNAQQTAKMKIAIYSAPGHVLKYENKYHRKITTNTRELKTDKQFEHFKLTNEEIFIFMADEKYDAATNKKSVGPSLLLLGSSSALNKATVTLGQLFSVGTELNFSGQQINFNFGIWEGHKPMPNNAALKMLKENLPVYTKELNRKSTRGGDL